MSALHSILTKDGLTAADLERVYNDSAGRRGFLAEVVAEIQAEDSVTIARASWLLLRCATDRIEIPVESLRAATEMVANSTLWEARLHLCQLFSRIDCPAGIKEQAFEFLVHAATDKRAFLRAWALSALHRLSRTLPDHRKEIQDLLRNAHADPAKAVQARLRQLEKRST